MAGFYDLDVANKNIMLPGTFAAGTAKTVYLSDEEIAYFTSKGIGLTPNNNVSAGLDLKGNPVTLEIDPKAFAKSSGPIPLICGVGDSITAQGFGGSLSLGYTFTSAGFLPWAAFLSRRRVELTPASNHGVSGQTTTEIRARFDAVLALNPGVITILAGTNDISTIAVAKSIENLAYMYDAAAAANIYVIAILITPRGGLTAAQYGKIHQINNWIRSQRYIRKNFYVVDASLAYGDPTTGAPRLTMSDDQLHPVGYGAYAIGNEVAKIINQIYPLPFVPFNNVLDVYSADNPTGNLLANGLMTGTGGSLSNGPTGTLATNWTCNGVNMPAGSTTAFAKVTKSDGRDFQQITFGGTYTNANPGNLNVTSSSVHANCAAGDVLEAICELEVYAGAVNLASAQLLLNIATPSGNPIPQDMAANNTYLLPPVAFDGILKTPKVVLPATPTSVQAILRLSAKGNAGAASLAGVVRFGSVSIRKTTA